MAEDNPIRKEDIIDIDGTTAGLKELIKLFNVILALMDQVKEQGKGMLVPMQNINPATKEGQVALVEMTENVNELKKTYTDLEKVQNRLSKLRKEEALRIEEVNQAIARQKKDNKDFVASQSMVDGSLTQLRKQLSELKKAYADASPDKRGALLDGLKKVDGQVNKLEKDMNVHTRGVGKYKEEVLAAGKQLLGFTGIIGSAIVIVNKIKDAFTETVTGMNMMNQVTGTLKQAFYDLVTTASISQEKIFANLQVIRKQNELRQGDILDLVKISKLESEIADLRYKSSDVTRSEAEQLSFLNQAMAKEDELIEYKIKDAHEELAVIQEALKLRPQDYKLQVQYAQKIAEINQATSDRNLRLQSRSSALRKKDQAEQAKWQEKLGKWHEEIDKQNTEAVEKERKQKEDSLKIDEEMFKTREQWNEKLRADRERAGVEEMQRLEAQYEEEQKIKAQEQSDLEKFFQAGAQANAERMEWNKERHDQETENNDKEEEDEREKIETMIQLASEATTVFGNILERRKQKELSAAGDNAKKREEIERKYAQKEKGIAIAQTIISGAQAIVKTFATMGWPAGIIGAAITAGITASQIAVIAAQKFAEGGEIDGKPHSQGGTIIEAERGEFVVKKDSYSKYRDLVRAINDDNPMRIAEELRNRQFHTVWGGVQQTLSEVSRQDPFTKKMYELMASNVVSYQDSNGDTVLVYPNKVKQVIRHK